jgi:hypothetical protein
VLSALMLLALFIVSVETGAPVERAAPVVIAGDELQAVVGRAESADGKLAFSDYSRGEDVATGVAVWRGRIEADDIAFLHYELAASDDADLMFIWRTSRDPRVLYNTELEATQATNAWLDLSRQEEWQGTILEVGVYAQMEDASSPLSISSLSLEPRNWRGELATVWSQWTRWRGWTAGSINYIYGSEDPAVLSPVIVAAAWSALAALLLLLAGLVKGQVQVAALAGAFLVPWLALDLLWQNKLSTQLALTKTQFAGKTVAEKHLADIDGDIYRYITRLKQDVLPAESARIVILHNSYSHNFDRLKAQYYLLPHSAYNFGRVPPKRGLRTVDYILVLGELPAVSYSESMGALIWKRGKRVLPVERVDTDPMGSLYRVGRAQADVERDQ